MKNVIRKLKRIKKAIQNGLFFDRIGRRLIKFNRNRYMRHIKIKKNKVIFVIRDTCNTKTFRGELHIYPLKTLLK